MFTLFFRSIILYGVMLLLLRGMGKRQQQQFQPYEFAITLIVANLVSTPMADISTPLLHGVLPTTALFILHSIITLLIMKSDKFRAFISGKPSVVMSRGIIDKKELSRLCLSMSDLLEGIRESGILDPSEVGTAVVEADGHITAFPHVAHRPVTTGDMDMDPGYEGLPLMLIMDGRVQINNLAMSGYDEKWLCELLRHYHLTTQDVLLASLDTKGRMHVQDFNDTIISIRALKPEQVVW